MYATDQRTYILCVCVCVCVCVSLCIFVCLRGGGEVHIVTFKGSWWHKRKRNSLEQ